MNTIFKISFPAWFLRILCRIHPANTGGRFIFLLLCGSLPSLLSAQSKEEEGSLKAVFIYNFTNYVDWDSTDLSGEFVIGVMGNSAVSGSLTEIAKTKTIKNRKIVIKRFNKPEDIGFCNILFIPKNNTFSLRAILAKTGRGVLTVSERDGFARQGTAFNFILVNDKLKFEVNLKALDAAGLKASSQLLKLAFIVN